MIGVTFVLPSSLKVSIYFLDFLQQFLPLPGFGIAVVTSAILSSLRPHPSRSSSSFHFTPIPLQASFPLTVSHFSLLPEVDNCQNGQHKPGSHNSHEGRSRDVAESQRTHLLSFYVQGRAQCATSPCVCVCAARVLSRIHLLHSLRKSRL